MICNTSSVHIACTHTHTQTLHRTDMHIHTHTHTHTHTYKCTNTTHTQRAHTGVSLGWLCVHHQPGPPPRLCAPADGQVLHPHLRGLLHLLPPGTHHVHAGTLRGVPANQNQRTYGCRRYWSGMEGVGVPAVWRVGVC